jgi:hypothetical protein
MGDTKRVTCGCGDHDETEINECDHWKCDCGNEPHLDGFYACDGNGNEVEPTAEAWPLPLYVCGQCGAIYDQNTGKAVGQRAEERG